MAPLDAVTPETMGRDELLRELIAVYGLLQEALPLALQQLAAGSPVSDAWNI